MKPLKTLAAVALVGSLIVGCSTTDDGATVRNIDDTAGAGSASGAGSGSGSASAPANGGTVSAGDELFTPVSDVSSHAAIGEDIAAIKALLDVAKEGQPVDWAAVDTLFTEGEASLEGDGTPRSMATLVETDAAAVVVAEIDAAIAGSGAAAGLPDAERAQLVDKGMSVLLGLKVSNELAAANTKVAAGETDRESGAPHNVDEAWAFFTADGNGLASTATKRAADFDKDGQVTEPVLEALTAAQTAAIDGDAAAFATASADTQSALNYIFYLATFKYLDSADDPIARAEGQAFYWSIQPIVAAAAPDADAAIVAALASGDAATGRAALNQPAVLEALGLTADQAVSE